MVIPIHDQNPVRRTPVVTMLLVLVSVVVFLLTPAASSTGLEADTPRDLCRQAAFYEQYAAIPREMTSNEPLARVPTGEVRDVRGDRVLCATGRPSYEKVPFFSVLTSMFLHGGWLHLLGNMLFLWIFGNNVEDRFGRLRFLLFYLFCGYVAAYGFALASPNSTTPLIGASGAVAGALGAYLVLFPRARVWSLVPIFFFIPLRLPAWFVLGLWFVLQWLYSAGYAVSEGGSVAYLAHVVGFVTGMIITLIVIMSSRQPDRWQPIAPRRPRRR